MSKLKEKQTRKFKATFSCEVQLAHPEATLSDAFKHVQFFGVCCETDCSDKAYYELYVQAKRPLRTSQIKKAIAALHRSIDHEAIEVDTFNVPPEDLCTCLGCFNPRGRKKRSQLDDEYEVMEQDVEVMTTCSLRQSVLALRAKVAEAEALIETLYDETLVLEDIVSTQEAPLMDTK